MCSERMLNWIPAPFPVVAGIVAALLKTTPMAEAGEHLAPDQVDLEASMSHPSDVPASNETLNES